MFFLDTPQQHQIAEKLEERLDEINGDLPDDHFLQTLADSKKTFLENLKQITQDQLQFELVIGTLPVTKRKQKQLSRFVSQYFQQRRAAAASQEAFVRLAYQTLNEQYQTIKLAKQLFE